MCMYIHVQAHVSTHTCKCTCNLLTRVTALATSSFQWELFKLPDLDCFDVMLKRLLKQECENIVMDYEAYRMALCRELERRHYAQYAFMPPANVYRQILAKPTQHTVTSQQTSQASAQQTSQVRPQLQQASQGTPELANQPSSRTVVTAPPGGSESVSSSTVQSNQIIISRSSSVKTPAVAQLTSQPQPTVPDRQSTVTSTSQQSKVMPRDFLAEV